MVGCLPTPHSRCTRRSWHSSQRGFLVRHRRWARFQSTVDFDGFVHSHSAYGRPIRNISKIQSQLKNDMSRTKRFRISGESRSQSAGIEKGGLGPAFLSVGLPGSRPGGTHGIRFTRTGLPVSSCAPSHHPSTTVSRVLSVQGDTIPFARGQVRQP